MSSAKVRHDGRLLNEIRNISIQSDVVHNATGSAYVEMGGTKIIGSVFGPRELARGEEFSLEVRSKLITFVVSPLDKCSVSINLSVRVKLIAVSNLLPFQKSLENLLIRFD